MNEKTSGLFSGGVEHRKNGCKRESGSMMEQRYVKPTTTHVAAELLDKKPGVRVPILTRKKRRIIKWCSTKRKSCIRIGCIGLGGARRISSFHCWRWWCFRR